MLLCCRALERVDTKPPETSGNGRFRIHRGVETLLVEKRQEFVRGDPVPANLSNG